MDDLLKIAQETMKDFNPETDSVNEYEMIPDGEYNCLLEDVKHKESQNGNPCITFKLSIMDGDYEGKYLFQNIYFTKKTAGWSVKRILKIAHNLGYSLPEEAFNTYDNLANTLNDMAGNTCVVSQKINKQGYGNAEIL